MWYLVLIRKCVTHKEILSKTFENDVILTGYYVIYTGDKISQIYWM